MPRGDMCGAGQTNTYNESSKLAVVAPAAAAKA